MSNDFFTKLIFLIQGNVQIPDRVKYFAIQMGKYPEAFENI